MFIGFQLKSRKTAWKSDSRPLIDAMEDRWCPDNAHITLDAVVKSGHEITISGHVIGDQVSGLHVSFSGAVVGDTITDSEGFYNYTSVANFGAFSRVSVPLDLLSQTQGIIEFTQEQWQAIAQHENPTVIEPRSQAAYVVIPKDEYEKMRVVSTTEADAAYVLRVAWMRRMRLDEDEIADSIKDDPPKSVHEEMKHIKALDSLDKITPPGEVLRKYAIKY